MTPSAQHLAAVSPKRSTPTSPRLDNQACDSHLCCCTIVALARLNNTDTFSGNPAAKRPGGALSVTLSAKPPQTPATAVTFRQEYGTLYRRRRLTNTAPRRGAAS